MAEKKTKVLFACVEPGIRSLATKVAIAKGVSISEYVRGLVIEDLDSRGMIKPGE